MGPFIKSTYDTILIIVVLIVRIIVYGLVAEPSHRPTQPRNQRLARTSIPPAAPIPEVGHGIRLPDYDLMHLKYTIWVLCGRSHCL
jgi:hypothetical protein